MDNDTLYNRIDSDDSLSDSEKREQYFSAIENEEWERREEEDS